MKGFFTEYVPSVVAALIVLQGSIEMGLNGWVALCGAFAASIATLALIDWCKS
ncbi:MAG: hypothetical protein ACK4TP_10210 [Hyphomicrobium sp.]